MAMLIIGLVVFLLPHSLSIFAPQWKREKSQSLGSIFKAVYAIVSLIGLVLMVYGYSQTRINPVFVWNPPAVMAHITALLLLFAMVLLVAAYVPGNRIRTAVGHPMLAATKIWGFAHLLSNGRLGDIILFASLMFWAVALYVTLRRRDRLAIAGQVGQPGSGSTDSGTGVGKRGSAALPTVITVIAGIGLWVFFAVWLHLRLIGVAPFGF